MGLKTKARSILAGLALLSAGALSPAKAAWDVGVDLNLGMETLKVKSPRAGESITVSGYTGTGRSGPASSYTLNMPSEANFNSFAVGLTPYVRFRSDDESFSRDFKLGVELSGDRVNTRPSTREGDNTYFYTSQSHNNWGSWPNAAVIGELTQRNIFVLEKPFAGFKQETKSNDIETAHWAFVGRLDQYNIKNRATTARVPYGSEWYGTYQNTITSSQDIGEKSGLMASMGLKGVLEGRMTKWWGFSISLEVLHGLPIGDVYPGLSGRLNVGYKF